MITTYPSIEDPKSANCNSELLCFYTNHSSHIQVLRIANLAERYWERVAFPGQRLLFEACQEDKLEVYSSENCHNLLADIIPCAKLQVRDTHSSL